MISIKQILKTKGNAVISVSPESKVYEALRLMSEKNIGALLVMENDKLVGIFSERDYARRSITNEISPRDQVIRDSMTSNVISVSSDKTIYECMAMMSDKHIRHLPVVECDKIVGVVSIGDVVNAVIMEQNDKIKNLENYITGGGYGAE